MDPVATPDAVALLRTLIDIDSTTGREAAVSRWVSDELRRRGWNVLEQAVDADRFNILATLDPPDIVFSTHVDCVPPFFPSRQKGELVYGRGACDAKGCVTTQIVAAERLRLAGHRRIGLLFVVGEERGSDGAKAANTLDGGSRFLVNGEPTDNRLGVATRGVLRVRLTARGRASHSSYPELGESAIEKLVNAIVRLRTLDMPEDPVMGRTHYTVGLIAGGLAPNVVPPLADAEVVFRTVGQVDRLKATLDSLEPFVTWDEIVEVPPVTMTTVPGFETAAFPYTTDIPFLDRWGQPLLLGAGSILVAHSDEEHIRISDLHRAADQYVELAEYLLRA
ncbi:MAG: M20/M25/M40 family metallo-hydrolase [Acidobacteria bacterium]|jgi:acetylornithine deacetylase|nr:MAG: M20/M25/M40 family metallo-hydrolase [Acidobacteriota bacterium]